jgi:hypothetical protein
MFRDLLRGPVESIGERIGGIQLEFGAGETCPLNAHEILRVCTHDGARLLDHRLRGRPIDRGRGTFARRRRGYSAVVPTLTPPGADRGAATDDRRPGPARSPW